MSRYCGVQCMPNNLERKSGAHMVSLSLSALATLTFSPTLCSTSLHRPSPVKEQSPCLLRITNGISRLYRGAGYTEDTTVLTSTAITTHPAVVARVRVGVSDPLATVVKVFRLNSAWDNGRNPTKRTRGRWRGGNCRFHGEGVHVESRRDHAQPEGSAPDA